MTNLLLFAGFLFLIMAIEETGRRITKAIEAAAQHLSDTNTASARLVYNAIRPQVFRAGDTGPTGPTGPVGHSR